MTFLPEQTIRYKTYAKRTMVDALNQVFSRHPDKLLQRTKATIEYGKSEVDYPSVVVRFFERQVFNAGVGHQEVVSFQGESAFNKISVSVAPGSAGVQLNWPAIKNATAYKIYRLGPIQPNQSFTVSTPGFNDTGVQGTVESPPTIVTATLAPPVPKGVAVAPGTLHPGTYTYAVTALTPSEAVKFGHYFYTADVEFAIYALSSLDRDLIADTLVQTIAMGKLEPYTNTFFNRVYPPNDLFPDSDLHFIGVNSDQIQGFGESQTATPWGSEDDLLYMTSYRVGLFGEVYSLPPKLTFAMVLHITQYPYIGGYEPVPIGNPNDDADWVSNEAL